ncbi:uncharacterized protein LOC118407465 [Branchiostoma floridae]|uniref:Uncharacterized protein LOC118407465 n=1 Tax=Branchiostoma floridae TaxID=7739 RepID=A0A9J7HQ44_BRAFL|nr:uncharacterized protein LOC118407465 [Branchiostoma floridae]
MPGPTKRPKFYKQYGTTGKVPPRSASRFRKKLRDRVAESLAEMRKDYEYDSDDSDIGETPPGAFYHLETELTRISTASLEHQDSSEESSGESSSSEDSSAYDTCSSCDYFESSSEDSEDSDIEMDDLWREESPEDLTFERNLLEFGGDLYPGSPVTTGEANTLIMMYALKHNLSTVALDDLMKLLNAICSKPNNMLSSAYKIKQFFSDNLYRDGRPIVHQCCSTCHAMFEQGQTTCNRNGCDRSAPPTDFYHLDIIPQLKRFFADPMFRDNLEWKNQHREAHVIKDIYDGQEYRKLTRRGGFLHKSGNITFCLNTDGVSIYGCSSKGSLWPVYLAVNELPPHLRFTKKYLILCGFWLNASKPKMTTFLKPLMEQLNRIYTEGFQVKDAKGKECTVRGMLMMATVDLQAKAICMMMKQYNGEYGCHNCEDPGKALGRGHRVWPYVEVSTMRTHESIIECGCRSVAKRKPVMGVKGASAFLIHEPFNMATGFPPDYMHELLLGVVKTILDLWLSPSHNREDFYIGGMISTLSERMQALKVPDTIPRRPRSLAERHHWKASELRSWLLFFSLPLLRDVLPTEYFAHYCLLVKAVSKLLSDRISPADLQLADQQLDIFCKRFEDLYGERSQTMNMHLLRHLAHYTRLLGPLWAFSCFGFEGMNGQLRRMLHGTRFIVTQITSTLAITPGLQRLGRAMAIRREPDQVLKLAQKLTSNNRRAKTIKLAPGIFVLGSIKPRPLNAPVEDAVKACLRRMGKDIDDVEAQVFYRLELQGITMYSSDYNRENRSNNRTVEYRDGGSICFGEIVLFCCTHGETLAVLRSFLEVGTQLVSTRAPL